MGTHGRKRENFISTAMPAMGRRTFVGTALAATAAPARGLSASDVDPVFAAIAKHASLWHDVEAACRHEAAVMKTCGSCCPEFEAAEEEVATASVRESEALNVLLGTVPTTPAGLLAWLDHLASPMGFGEEGPSDQEFPAILGTVRAFAEAAHA